MAPPRSLGGVSSDVAPASRVCDTRAWGREIVLVMSYRHMFKFDANFLTLSQQRIDSMVMRLAVVLLFLYSTPIVSAAQPVEGEPEASRERMLSLLQD